MICKDTVDKIGFITIILLIPVLPIVFMWAFFAPIGFWQNIAMLVISCILYSFYVTGFWVFLNWLVD